MISRCGVLAGGLGFPLLAAADPALLGRATAVADGREALACSRLLGDDVADPHGSRPIPERFTFAGRMPGPRRMAATDRHRPKGRALFKLTLTSFLAANQ